MKKKDLRRKNNKMNKYIEVKMKYQKKFNDFPMKFAFNDKQFKEGMEALGLTENDINKVIGIRRRRFYQKDRCKRIFRNAQKSKRRNTRRNQ